MIYAVIGLGFGDEGKGRTVDRLCALHPDSLVVRFNGGHQAGHTVVRDGVRHVFSNFGSGTLLGVPTYWSKFCTVDPVGILNEYEVLKNKGIKPKLYIDAKCPVVTPSDSMHNKSSKNYARNGTVGVGFGATLQREEDYYSLLFEDLFHPQIAMEKLRNIRAYYKNCFPGEEIEHFVRASRFATDNFEISYGMPQYDNYILEGAQGLLLDQHYGFFPNVTRSNTGTKNIIKLFPDEDVKFYLVTRAYQNRHGNGFMTNLSVPFDQSIKDLDKTNVNNAYQGSLRVSPLDLDLIEYAIKKDDGIRNTWNSHKKVIVTCLRHVKNNYIFTYKGEEFRFKSQEAFVDEVKKIIRGILYD